MMIISFNHKWLMIILIHFLIFDDSFQSLDLNDEVTPKRSDRLVVMTRHGHSEWSKSNKFCGWYDSPLNEQGILDGKNIAKILMNEKYEFDIAFTSLLRRATDSLNIILQDLKQSNIPVVKSWKLNERHYGELTGLNKEKSEEKYGSDLLLLWRRSYDIPPPAMTETHEYYADIHNETTKKLLGGAEIPTVESFETTANRVIPYWINVIEPEIRAGKKVLIVAHGTVLRCLIMHIEKISDTEIGNVEVPVGYPFYYEFDENMQIMAEKRTFLGDMDAIAKRIKEAKYYKRTQSGNVLIPK